MSSIHKGDDQVDLVDSPSKAPNETTQVDILMSSPDPGESFGDANSSIVEGRGRGQTENFHLDQPEGRRNRDARWEGIKAHSFKRQKFGEVMSSAAYGTSGTCLGAHREKKDNLSGDLEPDQKDHGTISPALEVQNYADKMSEVAPVNRINTLDKTVVESPVQTLTTNFNTSFCSQMAIHILLKEAEKESNFVFSPLSFHLMLSLIAVGSRGSTLKELLSILGSKSITELNSLALQIVNSVLLSANESKGHTRGPIVSFLNGAWVDLSFCLKPSFKEVLEGVYGATAREVDFLNKVNQAINEVNSWAENATKGLIKNLLTQECLGNDTALVLANALYFKGEWDRKFDASKTKYKDFHLLNGHIVQVPFMTSKQYPRHPYGSFDGYKVLKIPYQNSQDTRQFCMYFFLPYASDGLHNLIQTFKSNPELYNKQFKLKEEDLPELWIPKFKFSFKFEASNTMKELGLGLLFGDVGHFTEMVESAESLVLSKIFHESCIEVNEEGTEAAASTAPRFLMRSRRLHPPSFVADHPFMFMIKEENSGIVLFIGAVLNPLLVS